MRELDGETVLVCLSYLRGRAGAVPFSLSLNGVDFIEEAEVGLPYVYYEQPSACRRGADGRPHRAAPS